MILLKSQYKQKFKTAYFYFKQDNIRRCISIRTNLWQYHLNKKRLTSRAEKQASEWFDKLVIREGVFGESPGKMYAKALRGCLERLEQENE